ncbi:MAG TPA: zincin-like metallopeptidase domain-containing protein [Pseudolabrys sp.]|nr:zincin-like metallopeptidase domain-containing protein [Pseudolabrys sp.]
MTKDIYQEMTDKIVAAVEAGAAPWRCDWQRGGKGGLPLRVTGEEYKGFNILLLAMTAMQQGYAGRHWMTFNQAKALGGSVRKGEKGSPVVFFKPLEREREGDNGETETVKIPMMRAYTVFNVDQIDGLSAKFAPEVLPDLPAKDRDQLAEMALRSSGASISEDGNGRAFYRPSTDSIHLPAFERFFSTGGFLATMSHELVHWTGAKKRLDREFGTRFGDKAYAFEELVAEIGAAFICARLGVAGEHFENHAAYVSSWLEIMKGDKRAIFSAASLAQAAADFVLADAGAAEERKAA